MQKMVSRSIYNRKIDAIYMYDIPFDRSFLQLSNGIRQVVPSTDTKPELTAKASMAQPVSQPAVYANGLNAKLNPICHFLTLLRAHHILHVSRIRVEVPPFPSFI
jgi:hypothetical protein